ncbi:MAG: betaine/proline/choline family ABC transporter ATP-binding protein [Arenicellales bacterium]|jgi:glycine betaine/proline transport system ATP-binding protein
MSDLPEINEVAIKIESIWKIFGDRSIEVMAAIEQRGLSKQEVLEEFDCVIGVADIDLAIRPGEIFCIMGLSGSGKSTLVRHINRLLEPSKGKIFVNEKDILSLSPRELRRYRNQHIAMVFQNFALVPHRSVLDNIAMPLEIRKVPKNQRRERAEKILELVELGGWANKFAHELSGGMQQRVGLARALVVDAEILLMDEPFSALDPLIRRQLQDEFMKLAAVMKRTTVFITHDLDEAVRIGNRIAIMRDGRVVQIGTPEEIVLNPIDDYVSDFVSGISRLKVVRAHAVMQPIRDYEQTFGALPEGVARFNRNAHLGELINSAISTDQPLRIDDDDGTLIGVVTREDLLKTVVEGAETA